MKQYIDLVKDVFENGTPKENRTAIKTPYTVFGRQIRFDLSKGLPILTTKKMAVKACIAELLWFIEGSPDERRLAEIQYDKPRSELKDKRTIGLIIMKHGLEEMLVKFVMEVLDVYMALNGEILKYQIGMNLIHSTNWIG